MPRYNEVKETKYLLNKLSTTRAFKADGLCDLESRFYQTKQVLKPRRQATLLPSKCLANAEEYEQNDSEVRQYLQMEMRGSHCSWHEIDEVPQRFHHQTSLDFNKRMDREQAIINEQE